MSTYLLLFIVFIIGCVIGLLISKIKWSKCSKKNYDGIVIINQTNPEKDVVRFEMITPLRSWLEKDSLIFGVEEENDVYADNTKFEETRK